MFTILPRGQNHYDEACTAVGIPVFMCFANQWHNLSIGTYCEHVYVYVIPIILCFLCWSLWWKL